MIIRRKRIRNWTSLPNEIWEDSQLSFKAKGILVYLLTRPCGWRANREDLRNHSTDGASSIASGMDELRKIGYAKLIPLSCDHTCKLSGTQWVITDTKGDFDDGDSSEKPCVGQSDSRPAQLSDELLLSNTDKSKDLEEVSTKARYSEKEVWELYNAYPRHVGRLKALQAIRRALNDVPYQQLMDAVQEFAGCVNGSDKQFVPYPATWFNQGRWQDDRKEWKKSQAGLTAGQLNDAIKRLERETQDWKNRHFVEYNALSSDWDSPESKEEYRKMKAKLVELNQRYTEMISQ